MDMNDPLIGFSVMGLLILVLGFAVFWFLKRAPTSEKSETPYLMDEVRSVIDAEPRKVASGKVPDEIDVFYMSIMPDLSQPLVTKRRHSKIVAETTGKDKAKAVVLRTARSGGHIFTFMYMERTSPGTPCKERLNPEDTAIHTTSMFGMNASSMTCFSRNGWLGAIQIISCAGPYEGSDTLRKLRDKVREHRAN